MSHPITTSLLVGLVVFLGASMLSAMALVVWGTQIVPFPDWLGGMLLTAMTVICARLGYRAGHAYYEEGPR